MSMELYILCDEKLASIAAWQRAIDADGYALQLSTSIPLPNVSGALPVAMNGKPTAFEFTSCDASVLMADYPDIRLDRRWAYALAFRWGGDIDAAAAAYRAAASYAKVTDGVILDCEEGKIISSKRAGEIAGKIEGDRSAVEAALAMVMAHYKK